MKVQFQLFGFLAICLFCNNVMLGQSTSTQHSIDIRKARKDIFVIEGKFSQDFYRGDSVALASYYAKDGQIGCEKGKEIVRVWGRIIRNAVQNNTRSVKYISTALSDDGEYLVELGTSQMRDDKNVVKSVGKYVVVWKQEDGNWKIYRDFGL